MYKHMSPSVSPMIASGRIIKDTDKDAKVVFVAPCVAKRNESIESDLRGAIDHVITFRELADIFTSFGIHPAELTDDGISQDSA